MDGTHYEYTAVYVDVLVVCMKDPQAFCDTLKEVCKLKFKSFGSLSYNLVCGYTRDEDGTLAADTRNTLTRFFSPMKICLGRNQKWPDHQ